MGPFMAVIPLVISAAGAVASGVAASNQAKYQSEISEQNAKFAQQKANKVMEDYSTRAAEKGMQDKAHMGEQEARVAASGVSIGSGTAAAVKEGQQQAFKIAGWDLNRAATTDWYGAMQQQQSDKMQAELARMEGKNALVKSGVKAAGSLMSGGAKLDEMGYFS